MPTKAEKAAARAKCRKNPPAKKPKAGRKKQDRPSHSKTEKKNISEGLKKFNKCVKKKLEKKKGPSAAHRVLTNPDITRHIKGFTKKPARTGKAASWESLKGRLMDDGEGMGYWRRIWEARMEEELKSSWYYHNYGPRTKKPTKKQRSVATRTAHDEAKRIYSRAHSKMMKKAWEWGKKNKSIKEMKEWATPDPLSWRERGEWGGGNPAASRPRRRALWKWDYPERVFPNGYSDKLFAKSIPKK